MLLTSHQRKQFRELTSFLKTAGNEIIVQPTGFMYRVDFGPGVQPQIHYVGKDKACTCQLGADCPAVTAVRDYLLAGGQKSQAPTEPGFLFTMPAICPICGSQTHHEPRLGNKQRGVGWVCEQGGEKHYYRARTAALKKLPRREWLVPPVYDTAGSLLAAGVPLWE